MQTQALEGGFTDTPRQAAQAFRAIMIAMARPGEILSVAGVSPPAPLSVAAGVVVLTLCDPETPLHLGASCNTASVRDWIGFHSGAPIVAAAQAQFALGAWDDLPRDAFPIGTAEYPDRSTTLIVERPDLVANGATLQGPGIKETATLSLPDVPCFQRNTALFPLGLDFVFTHGNHLAALPRSTRVS